VAAGVDAAADSLAASLPSSAVYEHVLEPKASQNGETIESTTKATFQANVNQRRHDLDHFSFGYVYLGDYSRVSAEMQRTLANERYERMIREKTWR